MKNHSTQFQIEKSERDQSIKVDYEKELGQPYSGKRIKGSSVVVWNLSKKYKITTAAVYVALRSKSI